tara:strand:+ start:2983 stop:3195 length:213 start_codon:yes stop_codon:yes gene_type:complete
MEILSLLKNHLSKLQDENKKIHIDEKLLEQIIEIVEKNPTSEEIHETDRIKKIKKIVKEVAEKNATDKTN